MKKQLYLYVLLFINLVFPLKLWIPPHNVTPAVTSVDSPSDTAAYEWNFLQAMP